MRSLLLATSMLSTLTVPAFAQEAQDHVTVDEIIVTSNPLQVSEFETSQNIDVISLEEIQTNFDGSLGDTLSRLPGVSSTFFGVAAGRPIIRGLGEDRVRVLTNGVGGGVDAASASPDHAVTTEGLEAESIEVLRGPSALTYGGNAIGGVVNVIDGTVPSELPENGYEGQLYGGYESVNEGWQGAGSLTAAFGPLAVTVQGVHREGEDYDIPGFAESVRQRALEEEEHDEDHDDDHDDDHDHEEEEEVFGVAENSGFEFNSFSVGASLIGERGFIGVAVKEFDSDYGLPGHSHEHGHEDDDHDDDHDDDDDNDHDDDHDHDHDDDHDHEHGEEENAFIDMEQTRIDLRGEYDLHMAWLDVIRFSATSSDYEHTEFEAPGEAGTVFTNEGWEARLEITQNASENWSGAFGLQAFDKDFAAAGEEAFIPAVTTTDIGLFTQQRYDNGVWGGEFGARIETRETETATVSRDHDTISASGSLFTRPMEGVFLSGNLSYTERAPTDVELFADGPHLATNSFEIGDADLDVESAWTFEAILRGGQDSALSYEVAVWHAEYDGFIFLAPTGEEEDELPVFVFSQDDASLTGFEISADWRVYDGADFGVSVDGSLQSVKGELDDGTPLPRITPLSLIAGVEADWRPINLVTRAEAEFVDAQTETFDFELPTDSYTRVNLSAEWSPVESRDVTLIAQVKNAFDEEGRVHASYLKDLLPLPGRSYRLALRYGF